jgi:hypothetical protein
LHFRAGPNVLGAEFRAFRLAQVADYHIATFSGKAQGDGFTDALVAT